MKYEVLGQYRAFLVGRYRPATAKQYYNRAVQLFKGQNFTTPGGADLGKAAAKLGQVTYSNDFSQCQSAIKNYAEFAGLAVPELPEVQTRRRFRNLPARRLQDITAWVNVIRNEKLVLCYKIMLKTGLRVGELADIAAPDVQPLPGGGYRLGFTAKGGARDTVEISADEKYICAGIERQLRQATDGRLFYSAGYLQQQAKKRGFACHDLRRAFAKITYRYSHSKAYTAQQMRHDNKRTTEIYLKSKIEI